MSDIRTEVVTVRLTSLEREALVAEAARRGVSLSELFRMSAPTEADVPGWYRRVEAGLPGTSPGLSDA